MRRARSIAAIARLDPAVHRLCVAYFHCTGDRPDLVQALDSYVREGGSLLALHSVSASFKGNSLFAGLLGGVFTRHDPIDALEVHRMGSSEWVPFTVTDEPYEHRLSTAVSVTHRWRSPGTSEVADGGEPCAWTRSHGTGRVGYLSLGHRSEVWEVPGVEWILRELFAWCIGEASV